MLRALVGVEGHLGDVKKQGKKCNRLMMYKKKKASSCNSRFASCSVGSWIFYEFVHREFVYGERMENEEFVKVYVSSVEGLNRRERPLGRWKDRVKEYVSERGVRGNGLEWERRECMDTERWRSFCCGHSLGGHSWREGGVRAIDWLIEFVHY